MKTNLKILALLTFLGSVCAINLPAHTTYTWTGDGDGVSIANSNNWTPVNLPSGLTQDTAQWDGLTTSNLMLTMGGAPGLPNTGFGTSGISLNLTSNQTNSVQIISTVGFSAPIGFFGINIFSNAGPFTLGDGTPNNLAMIGRPPAAIHTFLNDSTNPATINPSVLWEAGGGNGYTYDFIGTGDWIVKSDLLPFNGAVSPSFIQVDGPGSVYWFGGRSGGYQPNSPVGTVTLNAGALFINNTNLATSTIANGGTLGGNGTFSGPLTIVAGATLAPGASIGSLGQLTISNNLTLGGNVAIDLNKSLSPSNDFVMVTGTLTNSGTGTLTVSNLGPALAVRDRFTLFNQPVQNGGALTITGAGAIWANNLAIDGSISPIGPSLNFAASNNNAVQFSWVSDFGSFKLQVQTNTTGLGTNWIDYAGGTNGITIPVNPANNPVFFRLVPASGLSPLLE